MDKPEPIDPGDDYARRYFERMRRWAHQDLYWARKSGRLLKDTDAIVASAVRSFERRGGVAAIEPTEGDFIWAVLAKDLRRKIDTEKHRLRNNEVTRRVEPDDPDVWAAGIVDTEGMPETTDECVDRALRLFEGAEDEPALQLVPYLLQGYTRREMAEATGMPVWEIQAKVQELRALLRDRGYDPDALDFEE